jgi:hypothetical protein
MIPTRRAAHSIRARLRGIFLTGQPESAALVDLNQPSGPHRRNQMAASRASRGLISPRYVVVAWPAAAQLWEITVRGGWRELISLASMPRWRNASISRQKKICVWPGNSGMRYAMRIINSFFKRSVIPAPGMADCVSVCPSVVTGRRSSRAPACDVEAQRPIDFLAAARNRGNTRNVTEASAFLSGGSI